MDTAEPREGWSEGILATPRDLGEGVLGVREFRNRVSDKDLLALHLSRTPDEPLKSSGKGMFRTTRGSPFQGDRCTGVASGLDGRTQRRPSGSRDGALCGSLPSTFPPEGA